MKSPVWSPVWIMKLTGLQIQDSWLCVFNCLCRWKFCSLLSRLFSGLYWLWVEVSHSRTIRHTLSHAVELCASGDHVESRGPPCNSCFRTKIAWQLGSDSFVSHTRGLCAFYSSLFFRLIRRFHELLAYAEPEIRSALRKDGPIVTDLGNFIVDVR